MSSHPLTPRSATASRLHAQAWQVWVMLTLMLLFQGLGQSHRVLHGASWGRALLPLSTMAPVVKAGQPWASKLSTVTPSSFTPTEGWGHQRGELICLLLDQLSHDQAPPSVLTLTPELAVLASPVAALVAALHLSARWKRGARGPPLAL